MRDQDRRPGGFHKRRLLSRHRYFDSVRDLDQTRQLVAATYCSYEVALTERSPMNVVEGRSLLYGSSGYGAASVVNPGTTESFFPVMIPLSGGGTIQVGHQRVVISTDMAAIVSATEQLQMQLSSDCTMLIVCIDRDALETRVSDMIGETLSAPLRFTLGIDLTKEPAARWSRQLMEDVDDLGSPDRLLLAAEPLAHYAEQRLINSLLLTQPHNYSERIPAGSVLGMAAQRARVVTDLVASHDESEPIGMLIRRARKLLDMSQYALADLLVDLSGKDSVSRDEVARWERGRRVPGPYWQRWLGVALDLPSDRLCAAARSARRRRRSVAKRASRTRPPR